MHDDSADKGPELNARREPGAGAEPAAQSPPVADERRIEERFPHRAIVMMPFGEGVDSRFQRAQMVDCSVHGIGLITDQPLPPRSRFFIKLKLSTVALVIYEVKYCHALSHGYRIGADFQGISGSDADCKLSPETIIQALLAT